MTTELSHVQQAIYKELAGAILSPSHDHWHLDRVTGYALALQAKYGGDRDVLEAAVLMHDLGRTDPTRRHGTSSIEASAESAELILDNIAFPPEKRRAVLDAISEHDQPDLRPTSIEARILKEADFLAGFGAWGVLRVAMWSGETGRTTALLLSRLRDGMIRRMDSLEFPESRLVAQREIRLIKVFLEQLKPDASLNVDLHRAPYIVLEGISGSGKDTQANILVQRLESQGITTKLVREPSDDYRALKQALAAKSGDLSPDVKKWLYLAARSRQLNQEVSPALTAGESIVAVRSYISTLVYQCETSQAVADTAYEHRNFPQPDVVLLLDVSSSEARRRIEERQREEGDFESLADLRHFAEKYKSICDSYMRRETHVIDASGTLDVVATDIWSALGPTLTEFNKHRS